MSPFSNRLTITQISPILYKTDKEFRYNTPDDKDAIIVPKGFLTDLASVPWPASMIIPKSGWHNQAAVLHDYLYSIQDRTRKKADKIFLVAMKEIGVSWIKRHVMWSAVRSFGWLAWDNREKGTFNVEKNNK